MSKQEKGLTLDRLSAEKRSWNMGRIRGKNTIPEIIVRSLLHRMGYRFSLNRTNLPGKPDIVLRKYKTAIFVHGCFWHRHEGCLETTMPKTRTEFWRDKFERTKNRDKKQTLTLEETGWRVIVVWECELKKNPEELCQKLDSSLGHRITAGVTDFPPNYKELKKVAEKRADYKQID